MALAETTTNPTDFVAYEYEAVRVDRDLEPLYKDAYRNFGWTVEDRETSLPSAGTVTLKLKRDLRVKNRTRVIELQGECEDALAAIARMERSKTTAATGAAVGVGLLGAANLAASIFALNEDMLFVSVAMGVFGLLGWAATYFVHGRIKAKKTAQLTPLIDGEYAIVRSTSEQAARLRA